MVEGSTFTGQDKDAGDLWLQNKCHTFHSIRDLGSFKMLIFLRKIEVLMAKMFLLSFLK